MAKTRDNYQIAGQTLDEVTRTLNFILQRMADRMDKIEGIRGTSSIESDLDMNQNRVTDVAAGTVSTDAARRSDLTPTSPTFTDVTVEGDLEVKDANGVVIHSME